MGKQSARLLYDKKDHKDIFFNGKYHKQMWVTDAQANPTLMWEKLPEDKYFGLILSDRLIASDYNDYLPSVAYVEFFADAYDLTAQTWLTVDWGDGTVDKNVSGRLWHVYPTSDGTEYEVKIYGEIGNFIAWTTSGGSFCSAIVGVTTPLQATMTANANIAYPTFTQMFAYTKGLKSVPSDLLVEFKNYNENYMPTSAMFSYSGLEYAPSLLFSGMKILGGDIFANCFSLETINGSVFSGANVASFERTFENCTSLVGISDGVFSTNNQISFEKCFNGCTSLAVVPETLFDNCPNIENISYCFNNCSSITSKVPALWEREWEGQSDYIYCYRGCVNASNYDEIPYLWK